MNSSDVLSRLGGPIGRFQARLHADRYNIQLTKRARETAKENHKPADKTSTDFMARIERVLSEGDPKDTITPAGLLELAARVAIAMSGGETGPDMSKVRRLGEYATTLALRVWPGHDNDLELQVQLPIAFDHVATNMLAQPDAPELPEE